METGIVYYPSLSSRCVSTLEREKRVERQEKKISWEQGVRLETDTQM
jgi:hypothetical protein